MALVSETEQNRSLDLYYGADKGSIASPSHEVAFYAGDPTLGGVEMDSAGGYERLLLPNDGTTWPAPAAGGAKTSAILPIGPSTDEWTVDGSPAVATHFLLIPTDSGEPGDSGRLSEDISVAEAGVTAPVQLTVFYNPTGGI